MNFSLCRTSLCFFIPPLRQCLVYTCQAGLGTPYVVQVGLELTILELQMYTTILDFKGPLSEYIV